LGAGAAHRVQHELATESLQEVLSHCPPPPMPVTVLYPQNLQLSSRVRLSADWLQALFAAESR
jgi:DNA-binding transcriptional LysR family regulator